MGYVDSLLASGERIMRKAHQHWFILVWRARWAVLGLVIGLVLVVLKLLTGSSGTLWELLGWVTLVLIVIGLVSLVWGWFQFQNEEYIITTRRLIHSEGVINKKASDSSLEKINDAILVESLFGRMFGFGDLEVLTASETGIDDLRMLRDAKDFKKAMLEAKHELGLEMIRPTMPPVRGSQPQAPASQRPASEPPPPAPAMQPPAAAPGPAAAATPEIDTATEIADALARLSDLHDKGVINPEEFAAKKAELLGRL